MTFDPYNVLLAAILAGLVILLGVAIGLVFVAIGLVVALWEMLRRP